MNVSHLLREFAKHGIELEPDSLSLPAPKWPPQFPKDLRQAFAHNRRAIMARIAPPIFLHVATVQTSQSPAKASQVALNELPEIVLCLAMIDDIVIIWLPRQKAERADEIRRLISLPQLELKAESTQIVAGREVPAILRRAIRSGRALCNWDGRSREALAWCALGVAAPVRWIELRALARAGGWPENFNALLWNLFRVRPTNLSAPWNTSRPKDVQIDAASADRWTTFIGVGIDQLLGMADIFDHLKQYDEPELLEVHDAINRRGIGLDVQLAHAVIRVANESAETQFASIPEATSGTMSMAQLLDDNYVLSWLRSWAFQFPDLNAKTIQWLQNHYCSAGLHLPPAVAAVLSARLEIARQPSTALLRALELLDGGGRVCGHMNYFVNRAGEFASCGMPFGALTAASPSCPKGGDVICKTLPCLSDIAEGLSPGESVISVLAVMAADCFVPSKDHLFGIIRWPDLKQEILYWLVGKPWPLMSNGMKFPIDAIRRDLADQVRRALVNGGQAQIGKCEISISPERIEVVLPSGRAIFYRTITSCNEDELRSIDGAHPCPRPAPPSYRDVLDADTVVDDIVRGICRDLVATALLRSIDAGVQIVAHGPDFLVMEFSMHDCGSNTDLLHALFEHPEWAQGLRWDISNCISSRLGGGNWKYEEHETSIRILTEVKSFL
ncbi:MAG: hypothetical protein V4719_28370 [Planctomycetota bacterium]